MPERGEVTYGSTTIPYLIVRSKRRRKTIGITLDPARGVLVSVPVRTPTEEVTSLVRRRAGWIVRKSTEAILRPKPKEFVSGESLPYLGRQVRLFVLREPQDERGRGKRVAVTFDHWSFRVTTPPDLTGDARRDAISRAVVRWYRERAGERLAERVDAWSSRLGLAPSRVLIRDQRQRWGSCSRDGVLRFNWRIVMAEPVLMDYVVVHELLHLRIRNHGGEFWTAVASQLPDYQRRREQLRAFGKGLEL